MAAVGVGVEVAADMGEEAEEMGRVLLIVEEKRPPLLLVPMIVDDTSRVQACPTALAAAAMAVCLGVGGIVSLVGRALVCGRCRMKDKGMGS